MTSETGEARKEKKNKITQKKKKRQIFVGITIRFFFYCIVPVKRRSEEESEPIAVRLLVQDIEIGCHRLFKY